MGYMQSGAIYFEIQADEPNRAVKFYSNVFGWTFQEVPGLPVAYWRIETGGARGGLLKRPAKAPAPQSGTNAFVCSFEVTDFDALAKRIEAAGGIVALAKFAVPHVCWQGYFVDLEGNTFGIFQPDNNAG
jgi:predicted enzyme related to lactoylglutathione lyase